MITPALFKKMMHELCVLSGLPEPSAEILKIFYEKLRNYDEQDFINAMKDENLIMTMSTRERLSYPPIKSTIEHYESERMREKTREELRKITKIPESEMVSHKEIHELVKRLSSSMKMPDGIGGEE